MPGAAPALRSGGVLEGLDRSRILIVDDEFLVGDLLCRWLTQEGYFCEVCVDAVCALARLATKPFSLVITDIRMPGASGIELAQEVKRQYPDVAVLLTTGYNNRDAALQSIESGAAGYMVKPFDRHVVLANVGNAMEGQRLSRLAKQYQSRLECEVRSQTQAVHHREEEIAWRLVTASEFRDNETGAHIRRIGGYSAVLAEALGWKRQRVDEIRVAAMMHDVGKIGVPDHILRKPGKLTAEETAVMRTHTVIGGQILGGSRIPLLECACEIARSHHERWDGKGYPYGLARRSIPEAARIVAVADVYDALVHERVYKPAFPEEEALEIMSKERDRHFDPAIFDVFLQVAPEFRKVRAAVRDSALPPLIEANGFVVPSVG